MDFKQLLDRRNLIARSGLGLLMVLAGVTKFTSTYLWTGYEPAFMVEILPLTAVQLLYIGGVFETVLGLGLISGFRTRYSAVIVAFWLAAITIRVSMMGLWDIAIRDLGLTFYAVVVALTENR